MPRPMTQAAINHLIADHVFTCHLVAMNTTGGVARATDWRSDIRWNGNDYLALGHLLEMTDTIESADLQLTSVTLQISGVDQIYIALALQASIVQQSVSIWRALLGGSYTLVADPILIFEGRISGSNIEDDPDNGTVTIGVTAGSEFGDLTGRRGRFTTDPMQQALFPGDTFFIHSSDAPKYLPWGRTS